MNKKLSTTIFRVNPNQFTGEFGNAIRANWSTLAVRQAVVAYASAQSAGLPLKSSRQLIRHLTGV